MKKLINTNKVEKRFVKNLLYKELSYQIHGAAIEVRKDIGSGHKEKIYQNAFARELKQRSIPFEKEKALKIYSSKSGTYLGLYRPDFIVDDKIIIEVKAEKIVRQDELRRMYDYLRNSKYELCYFINFASPRLFVKRIIFTNDRKPFLKNLLVSIGFLLVFISGVYTLDAASLFFESRSTEVAVGDTVEIAVMIDAQNENVNTIHGEIVFSSDTLSLLDVHDGGSVVSIWLEKPEEVERGLVRFGGIIPGGFGGVHEPFETELKPGRVLTLIFEAKKEGTTALSLQNAGVLLNDGRATPADVSISPLHFEIETADSRGLDADQRGTKSIIEDLTLDTTPPEPFEPRIGQDLSLLEGKYFLVFVTQDKDSGIDHYEILESAQERKLPSQDEWRTVKSPYILVDQMLKSYIYVKAVDKAGNERIEIVFPQNVKKWYGDWRILVSILALILLIFFGLYLLRLKKGRTTENA